MAITINAKATSSETFTVGKGGLSITKDGTVNPPAANNFVVNLADDKYFVVDAGLDGPALITVTENQDLHINPAVGGGQYLVLNDVRWPAQDGSSRQVLRTNGNGILSFETIDTVGSPAPATTATSGFAYIPVTDGTPTGTPVAITGYVPMLADSSGNKIWVYVGGVWKYISLV